MHAIGIDIGGTKIAAALVDEFGTIIRSDRRPTTASDPRDPEVADDLAFTPDLLVTTRAEEQRVASSTATLVDPSRPAPAP